MYNVEIVPLVAHHMMKQGNRVSATGTEMTFESQPVFGAEGGDSRRLSPMAIGIIRKYVAHISD